MELHFGFDREEIPIDLPDKQVLSVLRPNNIPVTFIDEDEVRRSLSNPIGTDRLHNIVKPGQKVVIITSDITRPLPSYKILPSILDELNLAGIRDKEITVVFALGSHGGHTEEEKRILVGDKIFNRVACIDSVSHDCLNLGLTSRGTPVDIFRPVASPA